MTILLLKSSNYTSLNAWPKVWRIVLFEIVHKESETRNYLFEEICKLFRSVLYTRFQRNAGNGGGGGERVGPMRLKAMFFVTDRKCPFRKYVCVLPKKLVDSERFATGGNRRGMEM